MNYLFWYLHLKICVDAINLEPTVNLFQRVAPWRSETEICLLKLSLHILMIISFAWNENGYRLGRKEINILLNISFISINCTLSFGALWNNWLLLVVTFHPIEMMNYLFVYCRRLQKQMLYEWNSISFLCNEQVTFVCGLAQLFFVQILSLDYKQD
jgi:hypothetical protein